MPSSASAAPPPTTLSLHDALPIWFDAAAGGHYSGVLHITSNDSDEGSFDVVLNATATAPEIRVFAGSTELASGGGFNFGSTALGARSEEHTSELQSLRHLVCRLLLPRPRRRPLFPYTTLFRSGSMRPRAAITVACCISPATTATKARSTWC